nr:PIG-L family deacetylase [Hydrotalea sp.]
MVYSGAHPDDPESSCGGTLVKPAKAGHHITIIYLTPGEAGIPNVSHNHAAGIRKRSH